MISVFRTNYKWYNEPERSADQSDLELFVKKNREWKDLEEGIGFEGHRRLGANDHRPHVVVVHGVVELEPEVEVIKQI